MHINVVDAREHRLDEYEDVFRGYKALQLIDDEGRLRGELIWRLGTGDTVEITEIGIFDPADRRQGWTSPAARGRDRRNARVLRPDESPAEAYLSLLRFHQRGRPRFL